MDGRFREELAAVGVIRDAGLDLTSLKLLRELNRGPPGDAHGRAGARPRPHPAPGARRRGRGPPRLDLQLAASHRRGRARPIPRPAPRRRTGAGHRRPAGRHPGPARGPAPDHSRGGRPLPPLRPRRGQLAPRPRGRPRPAGRGGRGGGPGAPRQHPARRGGGRDRPRPRPRAGAPRTVRPGPRGLRELPPPRSPGAPRLGHPSGLPPPPAVLVDVDALPGELTAGRPMHLTATALELESLLLRDDGRLGVTEVRLGRPHHRRRPPGARRPGRRRSRPCPTAPGWSPPRWRGPWPGPSSSPGRCEVRTETYGPGTLIEVRTRSGAPAWPASIWAFDQAGAATALAPTTPGRPGPRPGSSGWWPARGGATAGARRSPTPTRGRGTTPPASR